MLMMPMMMVVRGNSVTLTPFEAPEIVWSVWYAFIKYVYTYVVYMQVCLECEISGFHPEHMYQPIWEPEKKIRRLHLLSNYS